MKECVRGALKNKTILLVTHQVDFLHNVDLIMVRRHYLGYKFRCFFSKFYGLILD